MSDADRRARMLAQPCDRCGAAPGERCHTRTGRNSRMHADRWHRAHAESDGHQSDIDRVTDIGTHYYGDNCTPPHGSDRLLAAADTLDRCMDALESQRMHRGSPLVQEKRATVALLRAVESDVDAPHTRIEVDGSYDLHYCVACGDIWPCWPSTVHAAALALADAILGGER